MSEHGYDPLADYRIVVESLGEVERHTLLWDGGKAQSFILPEGFDLSVKRRWVQAVAGRVSTYVGQCYEKLKAEVVGKGGFHNTMTPDACERVLGVSRNTTIAVMDSLTKAGLVTNGSKYRTDYQILDKKYTVVPRKLRRPAEVKDADSGG